jgi:hypothetical protein
MGQTLLLDSCHRLRALPVPAALPAMNFPQQAILLAVLLIACLPSCASKQPPVAGPARVSLARALAEADRAATAGLEAAAERDRYNSAVRWAVQAWQAEAAPAGETGIRTVGAYQLQVVQPRELLFDKLVATDGIVSQSLRERIVHEGVGASFVAHWKYTDERKRTEPFLSRAGYVSPVTATLEFHPGGGGERRARLVLHDPRRDRRIHLAGRRWPLHTDLSATGEYLMSERRDAMSGLGALLHSGENLDKLGLLALQRPSKDHVPVIFVHGLMSRPATWQNVLNQLGDDVELGSRYQAYLFRYPSGVPVLFSAAKLREQLSLLREELQGQGGGRETRQMVLIGHSMGGLVSKTQVQSSGDRLWVTVFGAPPDELGMSPEQIRLLRQYLEFDANPNVGRVIFIATPHRGSRVADSRLGMLGRRLVRLPVDMAGGAYEVLRGNAPTNGPLGRMLAHGVPNSVDNLSPHSPYVQHSLSLPVRPGLPVHSIIGNKKNLPLEDPRCTDGIVPYSSAHLEGVASELVVPYGHSAHEHPDSVREIVRILKLHLRSL